MSKLCVTEYGWLDSEKQVWICAICGKELKNEGALRLHARVHKRSDPNPEGAAGRTGRVVRKKGSLECDHAGHIRLLNPRDPQERKALELGYTKLCIACEELM